MNLATDMGCHSGRATPSLHDTPYRNTEETIGRQSTYLLPITVQTNRTTSAGEQTCACHQLYTLTFKANFGWGKILFSEKRSAFWQITDLR